jgi:hypothetical protein
VWGAVWAGSRIEPVRRLFSFLGARRRVMQLPQLYLRPRRGVKKAAVHHKRWKLRGRLRQWLIKQRLRGEEVK